MKQSMVPFVCNVPLKHRMGEVSEGQVNQYELVQKLAKKHGGEVTGGGAAVGRAANGRYDIDVEVPVRSTSAFTAELKKRKIKYQDLA